MEPYSGSGHGSGGRGGGGEGGGRGGGEEVEKDMVAVAGLHGEQLAARQAEMSSNLTCIVGCIYAKELITAISEASGVKRVAFVGRELGELPLGWYTPLVLGSDAKMFRPIWINVGCLIVNPPLNKFKEI